VTPDAPVLSLESSPAQRRSAARRRHRTRRQVVTRAAEAVAPAAALLALALGLLLRNIGTGAVAGAGAGLLVCAIGLDLYARGLGAYTMRAKPPAAIILAVLGSPGILLHALVARRGPLAIEPGGLAFLLPVAGIVVLFAVASS
jgi:hypothetical protein